MMEAYSDFAYVYDIMMKDIPYDEWASYVKKLLKNEGIKEKSLICELGCGTGSFTLELSKLDYRMTGVDISPDMLSVAKDKFEKTDYKNVVFSEQNMTEFTLPEKVDAVVSVCDSVNYLLEKDDLKKMFVQVDKNLKSNGVFIMDLKSEYFYENVLAYNTMAENFDNCSYIWDNYYHEDERINEYLLTVFVKEGAMYRKFTESHFQKAYRIEEIEECARNTGFTNIKVFEAFTESKPDKYSERLYFVFKRG